MAKRVQFRRGTSTEHSSFTGVTGEVTVDTTLKTLRVHDSSTVGGSVLATQGYVNSAVSSVEGDITALEDSVSTLNNTAVKKSGNQTVVGTLTFTSNPLVATPTLAQQVPNKKYVDDRIRPATLALAVGDGLTSSTGEFNLAVGLGTLKMNTSGSGNTAVGIELMRNNTTGSNNTAVGANALAANTTGNANTAVGVLTLSKSTTGIENVAVGAGSLQNIATGSRNTAVGAVALQTITTGSNNVAIGHSALELATGTYDSIAIGYQTLKNTVGYNNVAIGTRALTANTTGTQNVAVGYDSLKSNTIGSTNVAMGTNALFSNTTGSMNTAIGNNTLHANTFGVGNTALGIRALEFSLTGNHNTALGTEALQLKQDGTSGTNLSGAVGIGFAARASGDNQVQLGNLATVTYAYGAVQNRSDRRDKADIRDTALGLDFIMNIRPVDFKWNYRDSYIETVTNEDGELEVIKHENDGSRTRNRYHHGVIAQEVKEVIDTMGVDFGGYQDHSMSEGGCDVLSVGYEEFIAPMIKAIQELKKEIEVLKDTLNKNEESEL